MALGAHPKKLITLEDMISDLYERTDPVLTWYGENRSEFNGPVLARWIAKIANLLHNDLSGGLWQTLPQNPHSGASDPIGTICIDLPHAWQSIPWHVASWLSGWQSVRPPVDSVNHQGDGSGAIQIPSDDLFPDVWITSDVHPLHVDAIKHGSVVMAHNVDHLVTSWDQELPEGIADAISEVSSHGDTLDAPRAVIPSPDLIIDEVSSWTLQDVALVNVKISGNNEKDNSHEPMISFSQADRVDARIALQDITTGHVIFIDQRFYSNSNIEHILHQENVVNHWPSTEQPTWEHTTLTQ